MKLKKIYDEPELDGFCTRGLDGATIFINVERLWAESMDSCIDIFINMFIDTYIHESLHCVIGACYNPIPKYFPYGEEKIIYALMNKRWTKWLNKTYSKM